MEKFKKIQKFFFEKMRINVKQVQFFVLFFSLVLVNSQARGILYSQNDKMTLIVDNQPLSTIFEDIESNSDFSFFYMMDQVDVSKKVSVNLVNIPLKNILSTVFKDTGISYSILKNQIVLKKNNDVLNFSPVKLQSDIMDGIVPNVILGPNSSKLSTSERLHLLLQSSAQFQVSGNVTDEEGIPLSGATVTEKGTDNGVLTDFDGSYQLIVNDSNAVLEFSYLGFLTQEIPINGDSNISVSLETDIQSLDEAVVVGFGSQNRSNISGSVASVDLDEVLGDRPITSTISSLQGTIPGLSVVLGAGEPGSERIGFNIRGTTSINGGGL